MPVLAGMAGRIDVPAAMEAKRQRDGERPPLPFRMEQRVVRIGVDRPHAMHAAHVMGAVHGTLSGVLALVTPIMLSRVTSSANCSSLKPSVPAGRSGSTR